MRLQTLQALNILDTSAEERFDRLTRLARRLFDVPIALVSLVDADRQWFKSRVGLDACETPRDVSFCGHAILRDEVFLVPDATVDLRFSDNPLVVGAPHVRFYAGCPLRVPSGAKLGTLCVIDRKPRDFTDDDLALLRDLAAMVERELAAMELATIDALTQLSNRRGFEVLVRHALSACRRPGKSAAMLVLDLDRFKEINDRFGHAEGDRALRDFARVLKETFREADIVGRLGGDEFAVLAIDADNDRLGQPLQRLGHAVDAHNRAAQRGYPLQYSVGAVPFDASRHQTIEALLAEADAQMYEQKERGRRVGEDSASSRPGRLAA